MKTLTYVAVAAVMLLRLPAVDHPLIWSSITISSQHGEKDVQVTVDGGDKLTRVLLKLDGLELEVPAKELEAFGHPRLEKLSVTSGADYYGPIKENEEPVPHLLVEVPYGVRSAFGEFATVGFLFHSGKYQELIVSSQTDVNTWKHQRKTSEGELIDAGTSTRLPNP